MRGKLSKYNKVKFPSKAFRIVVNQHINIQEVETKQDPVGRDMFAVENFAYPHLYPRNQLISF